MCGKSLLSSLCFLRFALSAAKGRSNTKKQRNNCKPKITEYAIARKKIKTALSVACDYRSISNINVPSERRVSSVTL
jgi:hypothetical protein